MADFAIERSEVLSEIRHGFFGHGGPNHERAHQFGYGGPGEESVVRSLRSAAADTIVPGAALVMPHQIHSPEVVTVTEAWPDDSTRRPRADALVTATPGIAIGIVTADCAPVLFADTQAGVVGAAHAGWRGAQSGVVENTLCAMETLGAERFRIVAAIGPTIARPSYEVDAPFRAHFSPEDEPHFSTAPERDGIARWYFDLPSYIAAELVRNGLTKIDVFERDTFTHTERYYSYRRASLDGEPNYGRQISLIGLG